MTRNDIKDAGENLMALAEIFSCEEVEIIADEILEELSGRIICEEDACDIKAYLST